MVGCNNSSNSTMEEQPISTEEYPIADIQQDEQDIAIVGGYTDVEDGTITDELKQLFDSVFDGFTGASYEPVELVATQVVAGTNYKFLANGTKTTNPIIKGTYYIYINKDLDGNISLLDIETIEESQEETKQEISKEQDPTKLSYWVVFYNPDGHELYRTIMKYGSTPVYEGDTPSYWDSDNWYKFVCWTDKQGNEIKEFKPIIGNTYIYAKYKFGGEFKEKNEENVVIPAPSPSPAPSSICNLTSEFLVYCSGVGATDKTLSVDVYQKNGSNSYEKKGTQELSEMYISGELSIGRWSHCDADPNNPATLFTYCINDKSHTVTEPTCLAAGTMITMADGSRKPVESLKEGDDIRMFNHNTGKLSHAKIMDYWQYEEPQTGLMTLHFTSDIDVNIVGAHGFFNKQKNKYVVINHKNINDYIGEQFYNADNSSWETLLGVSYSSKPVETFFIATEDQYDCIAEGMLTIEDGIYCLIADTFDFDSNMKVNVFKKYLDILRYGLSTHKDFPAAKDNAFKLYKLQYVKVAIGKGLITEKQWNEMIKEVVTYESENVNEEYIPAELKHSAK